MQKIHIFTDGSVNTQSKIGCGAYLAVADLLTPIDRLYDRIKLNYFEHTSSTQLELQTWLWAIKELTAQHQGEPCTIISYTDSNNIIGLPSRRKRLEQRGYTNSKNNPLVHASLYQEFFQIMDKVSCRLVKVAGHQPQANHSNADRLFALVDRASRQAIRALKDNGVTLPIRN